MVIALRAQARLDDGTYFAREAVALMRSAPRKPRDLRGLARVHRGARGCGARRRRRAGHRAGGEELMAIPADFTSQRAAPAWRTMLAGLWRWWIDELSQMVPERFAVLRHAARVPFLAIERDEVSLVEPRPAPARGAGEPRSPGRGAPPAGGAGLLERVGEAARPRADLPAQDEALVRRVAMPSATEENLRQVLGFEWTASRRFGADDVFFDYRVVSRDAAAAQLVVQLAVARRELVDARVEELRARGVSVQGVSVRDDMKHPAPLDLLPSEQHGERESARERMVQRALLFAAVVLAIVALVLPAWLKRDTVQALLPRGAGKTGSRVHGCHRGRAREAGGRLQLPAGEKARDLPGPWPWSRKYRACCPTTHGCSSST